MQVQVKKWGNSASVRIPLPVLAASRLSLDQAVDVREENGRIIVEPIVKDELQALIAAITPENIHHEVSFGPPVGLETL